MEHRMSRRKGGRLATILTSLLLAGSAYAAPDLGFAETETGPFLELDNQKKVFYAITELDGVQANVATVSNPHPDRSISVQIRAMNALAEARTVAVELASLDRVSFDLQADAVHLIATSADMFQLALDRRGAGDEALEISRARTGRNPRTNGASLGESYLGGGGGSSLTSTKCDEDWTLTCANAGCTGLGPFTHPGRIEQEIIFIGNRPVVVYTDVYWNLNTPIGDYETEAPSLDPLNPYTATWVPGSGGCPVEVTNNLGHTYTVTR